MSRLKTHIINFISLIINRGIDSLVGIVVIPLLLYKIGANSYGEIVIAQSISYIGISIINYGTDILLLQKIPLYLDRKKNKAISSVISNVVVFRFIIFCVYSLISITILHVTNYNDTIIKYYYIFLLLCLAEVFSISHVLVVYKDVKILPILSSVRLIIVLLITIIFVNRDNGGIIYVCGFSISYLITYLIITFYTIKRYKISIVIGNFIKSFRGVIKRSTPFFISKLNTYASDKFFNLLGGIFISISFAAFLDVAFKILQVIVIPVQILSTIILSDRENREKVSNNFKMEQKILLFSFIIAFIIFLFQNLILKYYSLSAYSFPNLCLSLLIFSSIFYNISIFMGENVMVTKHMSRFIIKSSVIPPLIIIPLLICISFFLKAEIIFAILFFLQKLFEMCMRIYYIKKY